MKRMFLLLSFAFLIYGCSEKKEKTSLSTYVYRNDAMDQTLKKGEVYRVRKKDRYELNDIVVFSFYDLVQRRNFKVAQRIAGLPGDTITIIRGQVFRNGHSFTMPTTTTYHYVVELKEGDADILSEVHVEPSNGNVYNCIMTDAEGYKLSKQHGHAIASMQKKPIDINYEVLLNFQNKFGWTSDDFGPVFIPQTNSLIKTDSARMFINKFYDYQSNSDQIKVVEPVYFVISDSFHNTLSDSRFLGLIGSDQIEGALEFDN